MITRSAATLLLLAFAALIQAEERTTRIDSPDGKVAAIVTTSDVAPYVSYTVERNGAEVVAPSALDVRLQWIGSLADGAELVEVDQDKFDTTSTMPWGKARTIRDHGSTATLEFLTKGKARWRLAFRVYNDGVAFRYEFPKQTELTDVVVEAEQTEFRLTGDPSVTYLPLPNFTSTHEGLYGRLPMSDLPEDQLFGVPLLAVREDGDSVMITEARLRDYAGMYLERKGASDAIFTSRLSPLPGKPSQCVVATAPHSSPWRVVMLADHPGRFIESQLIEQLNDPAEGDFAWLEPGKTTFPWWNGEIEHGKASTPDNNFEVNRRYIDFAARNGIAYHGLSSVHGDRPWHVQEDPGFNWPRPDADTRVARDDLDLPRILAYAESKGVGIRLWVHWKSLYDHLEESFANYEQWGVRGLMVDFMDRDDQEMIAIQEEILQAAARHQLHIQFHGASKPTGEHRTYPNLFNREGALNLEFLKWSDTCTPPHNVNIAYTRAMAGPTDYHLGGFNAVARSQFQPQNNRPVVLGTRCHHLAMYVVYLNPMPMVADVPEAYEGEPGFDFLVDAPTTWDETRFVAGEDGKYLVVARRKGDAWYLGGMNDWNARTVELPLAFLGNVTYEARLYTDGDPSGNSPNAMKQRTMTVDARSKLSLTLACGGGFTAILHPLQAE
ncbi:glycoside hydrolase family 97 protein [Botrimarina mediterranea]|uniref:Retaining alpha-galactosidase n=1 Tax=Botrimarina mediterranea TaxID=2528022 RepID=A0A518K965_9BACT|nr:glycoside hydrolase family 97 protein [Botrimarina mediterranea]QDV74335.1 Retaining alpha-galactosidase precursor [Botrimarina mediterranea]QDV78931.1 Retaining alpha-galactosidase precursor [Planctomycetes bacterium K2D]